MGKAQLRPFYSQGAAVAPPFSSAKSPSSQLEPRADIYLPQFLLAARPAAARAPFSSFRMVFQAASLSCLEQPRSAGGRPFPACWREEKWRSGGEETLQPKAAKGRRGGDENVNFLPKEMRARNIVWRERGQG